MKEVERELIIDNKSACQTNAVRDKHFEKVRNCEIE